MARSSDATLVTRVISGDAEAFEALVSQHQKTAHAIARAVGVPASNLDDVVQEAFLKAFRFPEGGVRMKLTVVGSSLILLLAAVAIYVAVSDPSEDLSAQEQPVVADLEAYREMERRLMSMPVTLVFEREPLDSAIAQLVELTKFSIQVKDVEPRDPARMLLSFTIQDSPFLEALRLLAAQHDFAVRITRDGVVLTGRPEKYPVPVVESK